MVGPNMGRPTYAQEYLERSGGYYPRAWTGIMFKYIEPLGLLQPDGLLWRKQHSRS